MSEPLKASSMRVQEFLSQRGAALVVQQMPDSTRTAQDAAEAKGYTVAQIAKSLIFKNSETGEPILVVASGTNHVDTDKVAATIGVSLAKANAKFVRDKVGFAIGGVSPVAHSENLMTLLDNGVLQHEQVWAAAGTPNSVFKLTPSQLGELTKGRWLDVV